MFWFASSANEVAKARAVLRAMKPQGILDELGFLVLLGAISDRLYPGISTVMTRARYLLFVPAIFRHIEERGLARGKNADLVSRDFQIRLCLALMQTNAEDAGIIGKRNNGLVLRPPSSVYWNALTVFGIATRRTSESSYLASIAKRAAPTRTITDDDRVQHEMESDELWSEDVPIAGLISDDGEFAAGTSLALSRAEASYLRGRILDHEAKDEPSLLGYLLNHEARADGATDWYAFPWEVPNLSPELARITDHARRLSLLARGSQLQYDSLLFAKRQVDDPGTLEAFTAWWEHSAETLRTWDIDDFCAMKCVSYAARDDKFLRTWRDAIASCNSAKAAFSSAAARDLVLRRERALRGNKARFASKFHLDEWEPPKTYDASAHYRLTFRQGIGSRIVADIAEPLQRSRR